MNMEFIEIGQTPCDESCAQVGESDYRQKAKKEMNAFVNQLYREFPKVQELGIVFKIRWNNHDFGTYGEVAMCWNIDDENASEYVYYIDANIPATWDEQALIELNKGVENV